MATRAGSVKKKSTARKGVSTAKKKKAVPRRKKTVKRRKSSSFVTPGWLYWFLTVLMLALVSLGAFHFFLRPYFYRWKPCFGEKEYSVCLPSGYRYYGIDVSHHQGKIDWTRVAASSAISEYPLKFVIMKATEGGTFKDPNFDFNIEAAREAGFVCGVYHFYNPATSPSVQAGFYRRNVSLAVGDLVPVVDVEVYPHNTRKLQADLLEFLRLIESYYGVKPIIYTSVKYRRRYLDTPDFDRYRFWIAHYYVDEPGTASQWCFWQFTDRARVDGIQGFTDLNVFKGSDSEFETLLMK